MTKRTLFGVAAFGVAVVLVGLAPFYERFFGRRRLRFPYLGSPLPTAAYNELAAKPGWAKTAVEVAPGVRLNGLIRRPSASSAPWILFYPGNDRSQLTRGQKFLIALAADTDWGLAVFAYRSYDGSGGKPEIADLRADAPQIFAKFCADENVSPDRVHLVGFSIGGYMAVNAAGVAAKQGRRAASLTLLASVNDIVMYRQSIWEKLTPGDDLQTRPYLSDVPAPVLVLQGAADRTLSAQQGRDIAAALGSRATYEELPGVDHVPLLADAHALELTRDFVRAHAR